MKIYYSPTTRGFSDSTVNGADIPADAIEISPEERTVLLAGVALGQQIGLGPDGRPRVEDRPAPSEEVLALALRNKRDAIVSSTDWLVQRHRDELDMSRPTTLSADEFSEVLAFRQALRDLPRAPGFPKLELPATPESIVRMLESAP